MFGAKVLHKQNHCIFITRTKFAYFLDKYMSVCVWGYIYEIIQFYL